MDVLGNCRESEHSSASLIGLNKATHILRNFSSNFAQRKITGCFFQVRAHWLKVAPDRFVKLG